MATASSTLATLAVSATVTNGFDTVYFTESGAPALSGYTNELTPYTFVLQANKPNNSVVKISDNAILWDFGDGSYATGLTAQHVYPWPGEYEVTITFIDQLGQNRNTRYKQKVRPINYLRDEIYWETPGVLSGARDTVKAAAVSDALTIKRQNSWQSYHALSASGYTVSLYASGSNSKISNPRDFITNKYIHFQNLWRFVKSPTETTPINKIKTSSQKIYANRVGNNIVESLTGGVFVGTRGSANVHYIDDTPKTYSSIITGGTTGLSAVSATRPLGAVGLSGVSLGAVPTTPYFLNDPVWLFATLDTSKFADSTDMNERIKNGNYRDIGLNYHMHDIAVIPINITYNKPTKLLFTANGINTFGISQFKYEKSNIPYVISLADDDNNIIKAPFPPLSAAFSTGFPFYIVNGIGDNTLQPIYNIFDQIGLPTYGSFAGSLSTCKGDCSIVNRLSAAVIIAEPDSTGTINTTLSSSFRTLTGVSSDFVIAPLTGCKQIAKVNENFDFAKTLNSYILQENIKNNYKLTNEFIPGVFGTIDSHPSTFGKTIYEKIANYVMNISDIETANVEALYSIAESIGANLNDYKYPLPAGMRRLVDLLSIKHTVLWGSRDHTDTDFSDFGYPGNPNYATNRGSEITSSTYIITAGVPIIARELYNTDYQKIDTFIVSGLSGSSGYSAEYNGLTSYPLSTYDVRWGWGLSVPGTDPLSGYYKFYEFIPGINNEQVEGVINWSDQFTTINYTNSSYSDWVKDNGIIDELLQNQFYQGLDMISDTCLGYGASAGAPTGLSATYGSAILNWNIPSGTLYALVYRADPGSNFDDPSSYQLVGNSFTPGSYTDTTHLSAGIYSYRVAAVNQFGQTYNVAPSSAQIEIVDKSIRTTSGIVIVTFNNEVVVGH